MGVRAFASHSRPPRHTSARLRVAAALLFQISWFAGCANTSAGRVAIPAFAGGERVALPWQPSPNTLAERASAERTRGTLGAAERFARWALSLDPEHPGALVEAARIATARATASATPAERARELENARRLYELAELVLSSPIAKSGSKPASAARPPAAISELADEREGAQLALAEAELALGRLEQASTLLGPLDQRGLTPRNRRLALHEALADAFIAQGARPEATEHSEAARRLGANITRTRLREAALSLMAPLTEEALAEPRRRVEATLGQSADLFRELALALRRAAPSQGEWAATRALALATTPENLATVVELTALARGPAAAVAKARELLGAPRSSAGAPPTSAVLEVLQVLGSVAPRDAAGMAEELAQNHSEAGSALALALWALDTLAAPERPPAFSRLFGPNAASAERLFTALGAAPERWAELTRHAIASGDRALARRAARLGAPHAQAAALTELELALELGADDSNIESLLVGLASLRPPAPETAPALEGHALSREDPRLRGLFALELLAARGRGNLWSPTRDGAALGPAAADIAEAWRHTAAGRLELAAQKMAPLASASHASDALAYARWLSQGARSHESALAWTRAIDLAPAPLTEATLGLAVASLWPLVVGDRLDRGPFETILARWLATLPESAAARRPVRALLEELGASTRLAPQVRLAILTRLHDSGSPLGLDVRAQLVAQLPADTPDLDDLLESAAIARLTLDASTPRAVSAERLAEEALRQQRPELSFRLFSRVAASVLERTDAAIDLVKLMAGRGEPERARRYAHAILARAEASKSVASSRMTALGDVLSELSEWSLARDAYDRAVALGDRSSRPLTGAIRASLRLSDEARAALLANQWLASRPTRDTRVNDELAQLFLAEGRLESALELTRARVGQAGPAAMDGNLFVAIADLLKRAGLHDELAAEAAAFAESDTRGTHRAHVLAAQKLLEIGRPTEALALLERGLHARPRDSTLLSAALTSALAARDPKAESLARRLLTEAPATWDLWARVLEDLRASGQAESAQRLADFGLQRSPGQSRLLISRGRVLLSLGLGDAALSDFAEGLARADEPRQAMTQIEDAVSRGWQDERLAAITARALALTPGRADLTIAHADALIAAGRDAEAQRLFSRFLAESDRGHTTVAATWFRRGFFGRAIEHWSRGFDQLDDREAIDAMNMVAQSLSALGSRDLADVIERLYIQTQRGTKSPTLMPLGQLHAMLGDRPRALAWLERADLDSPTTDTARALFEHHLADLPARSRPSDQTALLAHAERAVSRSQASAAPGRGPQQTLSVLQWLTDQLIERGRPDLAAALAERAGRLVPGIGPRLIAARALARDGRLSDALDQLSDPFPAWRTSREALPLLGRLAEDLIHFGHAEAASGLLSRGDPNEKERELRVARLRAAARAGHPERTVALARQLAAEQPSLNQWLMAEALSAERLPRHAASFARQALAQTLTGNVRDRATRTLAVVVGLSPALDASPRLRSDRWERAQVAARVGLTLSDSNEGLTAAHRAFLDALGAGPIENQTTWAALSVAALLDLGEAPASPDTPATPARLGTRVAAALKALASHASSHGKQLEEAGRALQALGLADPASRTLIAARELQPGHLPLALETARATLAAGRSRELARLLERGFSGVESPPLIARLELVALAAAHGEGARALELLGDTTRQPGQQAAPPGLIARAEVLALIEAEQPLWDEALTAHLAAAPEPSVARLDIARYALSTTSPRSVASARALALLEPLLAERRAPQLGLELALAAATRTGDTQRALSLSAELTERFPGPAQESALLIEAAIHLGHGPLLGATLRQSPTALVEEVLDAIARQGAHQPATTAGLSAPRLSPELLNVFETWLDRSPRGLASPDPRPGPLETRVALLFASGDPEQAVSLAAAAHALAPSSERAALLYADTLARAPAVSAASDAVSAAGAAATDAFRLVDSLGLGLRGSLMETEARLLAPSINPRLHLTRAELHLALGQNAQALQAWRRHRVEVTPRPVTTQPLRAPEGRPPFAPAPDPFFGSPEAPAHLSFGLALAEAKALTGDHLRGFLASCVAAQRAPWSGLCRARLSR